MEVAPQHAPSFQDLGHRSPGNPASPSQQLHETIYATATSTNMTHDQASNTSVELSDMDPNHPIPTG